MECCEAGLLASVSFWSVSLTHTPMSEAIEVRASLPSDKCSIDRLYADAFPGEDLLPLLHELLAERSDVLSLVAIDQGLLIGHVIFTACGLIGKTEKVALLAPLAVASSRQRRGVGSTLVHAGLRQMQSTGASLVFVLGDPAYYGRFGFTAEDRVEPPFPLPEAWRGAWQSLCPDEGERPVGGKLRVPPPWRRQELWAP